MATPATSFSRSCKITSAWRETSLSVLLTITWCSARAAARSKPCCSAGYWPVCVSGMTSPKTFSPRRKRRCTSRWMNVPLPRTRWMSPSRSSSPRAWRTVLRAIRRRPASSTSVGSASPGLSRPCFNSTSRWFFSRAYFGSARWAVCRSRGSPRPVGMGHPAGVSAGPGPRFSPRLVRTWIVPKYRSDATPSDGGTVDDGAPGPSDPCTGWQAASGIRPPHYARSSAACCSRQAATMRSRMRSASGLVIVPVVPAEHQGHQQALLVRAQSLGVAVGVAIAEILEVLLAVRPNRRREVGPADRFVDDEVQVAA